MAFKFENSSKINIGRFAVFLLIFSSLVFFSLSFANAASHNVTGSTFNDINDTIAGSSNGDYILLGNKTYYSNGDQIRVVNKTNLVIQGESDSQRAVLNAGHLNRIFVVDENSTVTFRYINFLNGDSGTSSGAAIYAQNTIIVENCSFRNNWGESGGAIFIREGAENCKIINSTFINNEGRYMGSDEFVEGGAIDSHANYTYIIDCIFIGNSALTVGGAVNFASYTMGNKLTGSNFTNNHAPLGGALRSINNELLIENCIFDNNYASGTSGGAIYLRSVDITIKDSIFTNNRAISTGGAIYDIGGFNQGYLNITNTSFINNQGNNAGAIYSQSLLSIIDSNFTSNRANSGNIGVIYSSDTVSVVNNNFINNVGIAISITGNGVIVSNNNFTSNTGHVINSSNLQNAIINNNRLVNNGGTGLYIVGNGNRIYNNLFSGNNVGVNVGGSNTNFTSNIVTTSRSNGVVLTGNGVIVSSNNFTANVGHVIVSSNLQNAVINDNKFVNNGGTGLNIVGNGNRIYANVFSGNNVGVNVNGVNTNFTNNVVTTSRSNGVVLTGNGLIFVSNNITSNSGHGVVLNGNNPIISGNIFTGNNYGINGQSVSGAVVNNNVFLNNRGIAFYARGSNNRVLSNSFISNSLGVRIDGNSNDISRNNIDGSANQGIYLLGNNNYIGFNSINNNRRNAIYLRGNSAIIERNNITRNSARGFSTIYINGINARFINNNVLSNMYRGVEIIGSGASVLNNVFRSNIDIQVRIHGNTAKILNNSITSGTTHGIYLTGNTANIASNTVNNNGQHGIYIIGNKSKINNNNISNNKAIGLYIETHQSEIKSNTINKNLRNAIIGKGNKNILESNRINDNSIGTKVTAVHFTGNQNTFRNNNLVNNGFRGLHIIGNSNILSKNFLDKNKDTHVIAQGNKNTITENRGLNGKNNGISIHGSNNKVSKNTINQNKNGIIIRGSSNQLNGNYIQSNSNHGVHVNGSKNKLIQNVIRANNIGINHRIGNNNVYNHNNIVNKKQNLQLVRGSANANFNWWGQNKVVKVKNLKVARYVVAKLTTHTPNDKYLKLNKTYQIGVTLVDDKNKKLTRNILAMRTTHGFYREVGGKLQSTWISHKNQTITNNKGSVQIKANEHRIHHFTKTIDSQKLRKIFYPPCDLKIFMTANPNPTIQGYIVTYTLYVNNLGPGAGYNVSISTNLPKLKNPYYSFTGSKWHKLGKNINMGNISKNKTKYVYIRGTIDSKFSGNIKSSASVKSFNHDLKASNNKYTTNLKVLKYTPKANYSKFIDVFANCGPSSLQHLLASKGIFVSKKTLIDKLKPVNGQTSMYMMRKVAGEYGLNLNAVKTPLNTLKKGDVVLLNISGQTHYVTIESIGKGYVIFNDPVLGPVKIPRKDFDKWYTGYTLTTDNKGKTISEDKQKELMGGFAVVVVGVVIIALMLIVIGAGYQSSTNNQKEAEIEAKKIDKAFIDGANSFLNGIYARITNKAWNEYMSDKKSVEKFDWRDAADGCSKAKSLSDKIACYSSLSVLAFIAFTNAGAFGAMILQGLSSNKTDNTNVSSNKTQPNQNTIGWRLGTTVSNAANKVVQYGKNIANKAYTKVKSFVKGSVSFVKSLFK